MTNPHIQTALAQAHAEDVCRAAARAAQRRLAKHDRRFHGHVALAWDSFPRRGTARKPNPRTQTKPATSKGRN